MDQRIDETTESIRRLQANLSSVIRGKSESVRLLLIALISGGHALLEDVPGTGKTTLAKSLARSINGTYRRVQFTPDLLPADITGSSFYKPQDGTFEFREGPVFTNVLLADEINRTSPRTQSALLEVMSESQVTVEGKRRDLPRPFFVVATQNPTEYQGTYPLPEAQLDRFALRIGVGYPDPTSELEMLFSQRDHHPFEDLQPVLTCEQVIAMQDRVKQVRVDASVADYIVRLVGATRGDARLRLGVSPRGSLALYRTAQAGALLDGRDFITPDDVRAMAVSVLAHRVVLDSKAKYGGLRTDLVIEETLAKTSVPR
ncbi:MAG: MoxR family ATPase [Phycisphaerae bacterium]|nr:MoxR family ATPase [Phycisphaerae bacterium]